MMIAFAIFIIGAVVSAIAAFGLALVGAASKLHDEMHEGGL